MGGTEETMRDPEVGTEVTEEALRDPEVTFQVKQTKLSDLIKLSTFILLFFNDILILISYRRAKFTVQQ